MSINQYICLGPLFVSIYLIDVMSLIRFISHSTVKKTWSIFLARFKNFYKMMPVRVLPQQLIQIQDVQIQEIFPFYVAVVILLHEILKYPGLFIYQVQYTYTYIYTSYWHPPGLYAFFCCVITKIISYLRGASIYMVFNLGGKLLALTMYQI